MSLVSSKELLEIAKKEKRAVGAFNFTNLEQLKAIVQACILTNTGCILATSETAIDYMGIENIVSVVKNEVKNLDIKFALHLDHGKSLDICKKCINNGYTSVMIDASNLPFEENVRITKEVVKYAKKKRVSVEAELGKLKGIEDIVDEKESVFTSPQEAKKFIEQTGVDSLAISIGTSHGAYKFKGESRLQISLLKEIDEITNHFPLVLHGASSVSSELKKEFTRVGGNIEKAKGVDDKSIKDAISGGICKINVDTDLRIAFTTGVRRSLLNENNFNLRDYLIMGKNEMTKEVVNRINLFNNNWKVIKKISY